MTEANCTDSLRIITCKIIEKFGFAHLRLIVGAYLRKVATW